MRYVINRLFSGLVTIWIATLVVSGLIRLVPGDPIQLMFAQSQTTSPEQIEAIRHELGLDLPWYQQYFIYMGKVLQGDFGKTIRGQQPVLALLLTRIPNTLLLASSALIISLTLGGIMGLYAAYYHGSWFDTFLMSSAIFGMSIPQFWLGLIFIYVFSMRLQWFPVSGTDFANLILPAFTLGLTNTAVIARLTRSSMIDVLNKNYMRTARAKGLSELNAVGRHALPNALVTIITMLGLQFTYMMGGAIVVENVFAWNGVGRFAIGAIMERDYPVIQGFILFFAIVVVMISIMIDLLYAVIDPRVRYR